MTNEILKTFVNSTELKTLLDNKHMCHRTMKLWVQDQTDAIIACAQKICDEYNKKRMAYNSDGNNHHKIYIAPRVKIDTKSSRTYLSIQWVRFENGAYRGRPEEHNVWRAPEIATRGKHHHYSKHDLISATHGNGSDFMPVILETEHALRFCREHYVQLSTLERTARTFELPALLSYLCSSELETFTDSEFAHRDQYLKKSEAGIFIDDPLCVSKKHSLFNEFYQQPGEHHAHSKEEDH